jgi:5-methylcytosine-specific restriction endonuclease McrA
VLKKCNKCRIKKDTLEFSKSQNTKDGFWFNCNSCRPNWTIRQSNIKKVESAEFKKPKSTKSLEDKKIEQRDYYNRNKEKRLEYARKRYAENTEIIKSRVKKYNSRNRGATNALKAKYRASKYKATPPWLTKDHLSQIKSFYKKARSLSEEVGELYQVDHIVPLQGKDVCGLHVPWNLQILTKAENIRKFNKLISY